MRLLALMILLASCSAHGDESDNYYNDADEGDLEKAGAGKPAPG